MCINLNKLVEPPNVDFILGPSTLLVTKQSLHISRGYGPILSDCEVYALTHVIGFHCDSSRGADIRLPNGSAVSWIASLVMFAAALYGFRQSGMWSTAFLTPALASFCAFFIAAKLESNPVFGPTTQYGLRISLHSGGDKLIPGRSEFEVMNVVSKFSEFMEKGAYLSHLKVENHGKGLQATLERHCPN